MLSVILWIFFFHRCFHLVSAYSESSYDFYLLEECPLNTLVGIVSLETSTSYRTSASSPEVKDSFFLNHSTGEIRTLKRIDRESIQAFNDTVDLIFVSQTASLISVHVHILDINDNPPVFVQGFNNISIVEGATPGTRFPLQKARDPDKGENGTIAKYLLKPENLGIPNPFKITRVTDPDGEDSLFLELLDSLDREKEASYSFEIQVVDGGSPPLISNSFVFVNILDVNDNAPTFDEGIKNITIRSLGEEGEIVTNISAHDADSGVNSELTFSLLDDVKGQFEIDPSSGIIKRKKKRIICQKDSCGLCLQKLCVLAVEAQDQGSPKLTGRTFLNVHLIDENFFTPQITFKIYPTRSDYVLLDPSFETGTTLVVLTAADGDFGKDGQTEISLISGNEGDFFRLESGQNFAILRLNKVVDKKTPKQFSLEFEASDFGNPPKKSKKMLMIYVKSENDKPPKFEKQNFEITVPEATRPGTRISRIRVRSENGEPELRLLDLDKDLPFSLNPETGVLRVSKNLDFDLRSRYDFEIEASDPVYHWLKSTSKIVVQISDSNNHSPSFLEKRPFISVPENFNIRDPVFRAKCLDLDYAENGAVFYQLIDADLPLVKVDEKKGDVFLLQELDFEKTKNFTFRLSCFDDGIPKKMDSTTVTVFVEDINDNSPFFDSEILEVNVRQNDPVGTQLATVEAWDLDELDRGLLKYFVIDSLFNDIDVNEETGTLFIKSPMNTHESGSSFKVTVGAKDIGGHFSSNKITVTIHVIDELTEIPVFLEKKRTFEIEENSPVNHLVGNFRATVSHKGSVEYDLLEGKEFLNIDGITGEIRTKVAFDFEKNQRIDFIVIAKTTKSVNFFNGTIFVKDLNDNKPQFIGQKEFVLDLKNLPIGAVFGKVKFVDADSGENGRVSYFSHSDFVGVGEETGLLWLQPRNTEIEENQWQITIEAVDNGVPKMSSSVTVVVKFSKNPVPFEFKEKSRFLFSEEISLDPKNESRFFYTSSIDGVDFLPEGEVFLDGNLPYQPVNFIPFEIEDTDLEKVYSSKLEIIRPFPKVSGFRCPSGKPRILENSPIGSRFSGKFLTNEIGNFKFKLLNELEKFRLDPRLGFFSTNTVLDAEKQKEYTLKFEVIDLKSRSSTVTCDFVVEVVDENDHIPVFEKLYYSKTVGPNFDGDIITVTATDSDIEDVNKEIIYSVSKKERKFKIDKDTGVLRTVKPLKPMAFHNVTVYARNPDSANFSRTFVLITVEADSHTKPVVHTSQDVTVSESMKPGSVVAAVNAQAMESSVHFDIVDGNLFSTFEIDPHFGDVVLVRDLDFEKVQIFNLTIVAKTKLSNSTSRIRINVQNEKDNPPRIKSTKFQIQENQKPGTTVGKLIVEDPEKRPLDELDVEILFQIPPQGKFYLNAENELISGATLDREETDSYRLLIRVSDKKMPNSSSESEITINIEDENDNLPECGDLGAFVIPKDTKYPLRMEISCYDQDQGFNASLGYRLKEETENLKLEWSGILWVLKAPQKPMTLVPVVALDRMSLETRLESDGLRSSTNFRQVLILDNPGKLFSKTKTDLKLQRTASVGTVVGKLEILDSEKSVEFFIVNSEGKSLVSVDRKTSEIRVVKSANMGSKKFRLDILGINTVTQKTEIHKVEVDILDNDPSGHFLVPKVYEFSLNESTIEGVSVGTIQVAGAAEDSLKFQFHSNTKEIPFRLDAKSGKVFVSRKVDFETETFYKTEVVISSKSSATTVEVVFRIQDANDNSPVFEETSFNFYIREDSSIGEFVGKFRASDLDSSIYGRVRYQLIDAPESLFLLDTVSGILTLGAKLDHEVRSFYKFEVRAYDIDGRDARSEVMVFVEDVNDNPPYFLEAKNTIINIPENSLIGAVVYGLKFDDPDSANNFNFEIDPGTDGFEHFGINNMGSIFVKNPLDRELIPEYKLKIVLKDSFPPFDVHSVETTITVVVDDVNDNAPILKHSVFTISEQAPVGTVIGSLGATDPDNDFNGLNSLIQYRIDPKSNPKAMFVVDPLLGYLIVNKPLDREIKDKYSILVIAEDSGVPRLSSKEWIEVLIEDEDDNPPSLDPDFIDEIKVEVDEDVPIGSLLTTIRFRDNDTGSNSAVIFEIVDGNPDGLFRIDPFGNVFVSGTLDFEESPEHKINVSLTPFSGKHGSFFTTVVIRVQDKNDEAPYFIDGNRITLRISENQEIRYPAIISSIKAIDKDVNQTTETTYSLTSGNSSLFFIDSSTGDLILNFPLDYEDTKEYDLVIRATDSGNPQLFSSIQIKIKVVDENDNDPVFSQLYYSISVKENSEVDRVLIQVKATDVDSGDNGQVRYSIENPEPVPFTVDVVTGEIRGTEKLDFEKIPLYRVLIKAIDGGRFLQRHALAEVLVHVIDENDNPPALKVPNQDILIRSDTKKGNVVSVINVFDLDFEDHLRLAVEGPDKEYFAVDKRGVIRTKTTLPKQSEYSIVVTASDSANHSTSLKLNFSVSPGEEFPIFRPTNTRFKIFENETDYEILQLDALSTKGLHCIRYSIASGDPEGRFFLDPFSGHLKAKTLDYERVQEHHLYIAATDCLKPSHVSFQPLVISIKDVNDNRPEFEKAFYELKLKENDEPPREPILILKATDKDSGSNGVVRYRILGGNSNNAFELDDTTGGLFQVTQLDREEVEEYTLTIEARDKGDPELSQVTVVQIKVLDENDNAPKFSRLLKTSISEDSPIGSFVIQVAATDPDTEEFSKNIYSIDGPDSEFFEIDRISGNLTLKKTLDREKKSVHKFKVYAQDGFWKVSASMTIIVEDSNDNSPKFLEDVYNFTILKKNVLAERKIGKITATDEDEGKNKEILYFLVPNITFIQIDPKSGRLSFSTTRDIADIVDTTDPISFEVGAMDLGSPSNVAITKVNIFIIDETHFENCEFVKESYNFFVNKFEKLSLGVIETQGYCIFDLEGNSSTVRIDRSTGEITGDFSGYKSGEELSFKIRARSISNSSNFVETEAKIIFKEKIDLVWKLEFYNFTVKENSELNTTIGTVSVNSSSATYEIFSNYSIPFGVDKDSGRIFVKNFIDSDFEPRFEFCQFEIHATVPGYFMKKLETVVNIRILDENDNLPEFGFLERTIFVSGPIPVGSVVFVSEASDSDSELFNEVFYSISKNNNFEIDTKSGEVFSLTNLDFSMSESYEFAVKASNFNSSKSSFCKIRIELRVPVPNTAIFVKKYDFIEISKRSKISTILTQLEAQSMFGIQYFFIEPLHEKFLMERNGILRLAKKLSLNESFVLTSIVKSGLLKRRAPTVCSIRISTNDLAPAPIFPEEKYFLSLPEDALDKEVLKFNFVLPSDSRMEVHGKDKEDFCFDNHSTLFVCKKLRRKKYSLTLTITSNGKLRSMATLEVKVQESERKNLSLTLSNKVSTIVENSEGLLLLKLKPKSKKKNIKFWIADNFLTDVFAINSSTGVLSLKQSLDRERRSLYSIPIKISDGEFSENSTVHVFVDDEDDNEPIFTPLSIWISSETPLFSGSISEVHPVDPDEINEGSCANQKINERVTVFSNCSAEFVDLPSGTTKNSLKTESGGIYPVEFHVFVTNEEITRQQIIVEVFGSRRAVADFLQKLQGSIPDMLIHITGVENIEKHKFKLFLSVLSPGGEILPAPETLRILDNFVSKKQKFLDVTDYRGYVSLCDLKDCGSDICQNVRILKNTWETFRSAEKLWHVPRVQMFGNCKAAQVQKSPSTKLLNEEDCGKSKCFHGRCIGNNTCLCDSNYFGETCSSRIYSFGQNSFLNLPLKKQLSKLSFLIITKESHGLLFYSRSSTSNSSIMIDYINGKPRISTTGLRGSFSSLLQESINDGHWHKVSLKAQPTGTFTFVVENCDDTCLVCQSINCHTVVPSVFIDEEVTIGGLSEKEITEFQPSATFLRACVKNISVDEEETSEFENFEELKKVETYEESRNFGEFKESGILDICPILFPNNYCESSEAQTSCGKGTCESEWDDYKCICPDGIESVSCNSDDQTISLKNGRIRLKLSPFAQNRLKSVHHDSRVFKREDRMFYDNSYHRDVRKSSEENSNSRSSQFLEIDVRTSESEAHIFSMKFGSQRSSLRVVNGSLHYGIYNKENLVDEVIGKSADEDIQNKEKLLDEVVVGKPINDGVWHRIRIEVDSGGTVVRLKMDDHSKEMNSFVHFPKFVFKELESMEFGSFGRESFFGCLRRLVINGQMQLLYPKSRTLLEQFFQTEITSQISSIQLGCENTFICENSISENPKISKCNFASLNPKTRFILVSGLCVIFVSFTVLLVLGLFHYYKTKKRRRLARNTQRISNLQLVSTIEGRSTYKNWSYDELDNTETNRHRCTNGHENSAYLSHNSLETTHIYDEATAENYGRRVSGNYDEAVIENYDRVASGNYDKTFTGNTGAFRPVKQFQKPMVMPRKKPPSPENQPTSSVPNNPYRSRFFRPGETFGLFSNISGNHNYPISLDDFHHEPVEEETGQMSQKV